MSDAAADEDVEAGAAASPGPSAPDSGDELESVEVITGGVDAEGNLVIDDLIAEVDRHGHIVATDEKIVIETPDGDLIMDETFSVIGEDGELHAIDEELTVIEHADPEDAGPAADPGAEHPAD